MESLPDSSRALVYHPSTRRLEMRNVPLRAPGTGEVVVRVTLSSLCRSDLHTVSGRRSPTGPLILGHEIVGTIAAMGEDPPADASGQPLRVGDRVTWSIAASCGHCFACTHGLPQKCASLLKYGHQVLASDPPLSGGFAQYCFLVPGTAIFRLPDHLPDSTAVFANCAVATAAAIVRHGAVGPGDSVLIQGAGLLGLSVAALCASEGAGVIAMSDVCPVRLEKALDFGATLALDDAADQPGDPTPEHRGFDVAVEVCGQPRVIPAGVSALRTGGSYVIAGCVYPGATVEIDMHSVIFKHLRIQGVHNYVPADLGEAVAFIAAQENRFGFGDVVAQVYPLEEWREAFARAENDAGILRVALAP